MTPKAYHGLPKWWEEEPDPVPAKDTEDNSLWPVGLYCCDSFSMHEKAKYIKPVPVYIVKEAHCG